MLDQTVNLPVLRPGVRRIFSFSDGIPNGSSIFTSTPRLPANSILRSLLWTADADLNAARILALRMAYAEKVTPVASDFLGTGLILPDIRTSAASLDYTPDPLNSARDLTLNLLLPTYSARLILQMENLNLSLVTVKLRMIIDSPSFGESISGSR